MDPRERASEVVARVRASSSPADVDGAVAAAIDGPMSDPVARAAVMALGETTKDLLATRAALDDAHRAREALFASVSHDLRNPLNTFAMSLGLLRDDVDRGATRAQGLIGRMDRASERMQQIIEDLMEASRIQAGKLELAPKREDAVALLREAASASQPLAAEKRLAVEEGTVETNTFVTVDRRRTLEALRKVIAYAIRCCSERGSVRLDVARRGADVVFDVTSVIPNHTPQPMSLEGGKGGVTLFIARGLVAAQGGTFDVRTGEGTTFRVTLPAAA